MTARMVSLPGSVSATERPCKARDVVRDWIGSSPRPHGNGRGARILVLSASAGAGHVRAAQALERAFAEFGVRDVRHVNALDHTTKLFRRLHEQAYLDAVSHAPVMLGRLYDHLDRPWTWEHRRRTVTHLNTRPFVICSSGARLRGPRPGLHAGAARVTTTANGVSAPAVACVTAISTVFRTLGTWHAVRSAGLHPSRRGWLTIMPTSPGKSSTPVQTRNRAARAWSALTA